MMDETPVMQGLSYDHRTKQIVGGRNKMPHEPLKTIQDVKDFILSIESADEQSSCVLVGALVAIGTRANICPVALEPSPFLKGVGSEHVAEHLNVVSSSAASAGLKMVAVIMDNDTRFRTCILNSLRKDKIDEDDGFLCIDHPESRFVAPYQSDDGDPAAFSIDEEHMMKVSSSYFYTFSTFLMRPCIYKRVCRSVRPERELHKTTV